MRLTGDITLVEQNNYSSCLSHLIITAYVLGRIDDKEK